MNTVQLPLPMFHKIVYVLTLGTEHADVVMHET